VRPADIYDDCNDRCYFDNYPYDDLVGARIVHVDHDDGPTHHHDDDADDAPSVPGDP